MKTINKILTNCDCKYGAPMGRSNVTSKYFNEKINKIFDSKVNLTQGYDKGGAYWGLPNNLRVKYTKDLSFIFFYRLY
jgi:hypothetical protein